MAWGVWSIASKSHPVYARYFCAENPVSEIRHSDTQGLLTPNSEADEGQDDNQKSILSRTMIGFH
jgi:hypothetical protein